MFTYSTPWESPQYHRKILHIEFTHALLGRPSQGHEQQHIQPAHRCKCPCYVRKALRGQVTHTLLCHLFHGHKQLRIWLTCFRKRSCSVGEVCSVRLALALWQIRLIMKILFVVSSQYLPGLLMAISRCWEWLTRYTTTSSSWPTRPFWLPRFCEIDLIQARFALCMFNHVALYCIG